VISLAGRDIAHSWGKFVLTGLGLGLLIGVTLTMAGVYRGMVDDAQALLTNSRADLWVVQKDTQGPYAESSSLKDDVVRSVRGMPGVAQAANVTYFTMQVQSHDGDDIRAMVVGMESGQPGEPGHLVAAVFRRAFWQIGAGSAAGMLAAYLAGRYVPIEQIGGLPIPGILPGAAAFMLLVGVLASLGPARRGVRIDPTEALRSE